MKILVSKNKKIYADDKFIVEGENKVDKLEFEFPSELENYIKFIVISADEGKYIDLILDNEYIITRAISNLHNISIAVICTNSEIVSELTKVEDLTDIENEIEFRSLSIELPTMNFLVDLDTVENDNNPSAIARVYKKVLKNTEDIDTIKENQNSLNQSFNEVENSVQSINESNNKLIEKSNKLEQSVKSNSDSIQAVKENQENLKQNFENLETLKNEVVQEKESMQDLKEDIQNKLENGQFNGRDGLNGQDGRDGIDGAKGEKGDKGDTGAKGEKGDSFKYEDFTEEQLANLKGEKGEQGIQGIQGLKGETGADGYTPQKGTDYYTEEEKTELKSEIEADLSNEELIKNMSFNSIEGETIDIDDAHSYSKNQLKIYGNSRQETREGYQLIDTSKYSNSSNNGINYTINEDKTINANGTASSENDSSFTIFTNQNFEAGNYYFEGCPKRR